MVLTAALSHVRPKPPPLAFCPTVGSTLRSSEAQHVLEGKLGGGSRLNGRVPLATAFTLVAVATLAALVAIVRCPLSAHPQAGSLSCWLSVPRSHGAQQWQGFDWLHGICAMEFVRTAMDRSRADVAATANVVSDGATDRATERATDDRRTSTLCTTVAVAGALATLGHALGATRRFTRSPAFRRFCLATLHLQGGAWLMPAVEGVWTSSGPSASEAAAPHPGPAVEAVAQRAGGGRPDVLREGRLRRVPALQMAKPSTRVHTAARRLAVTPVDPGAGTLQVAVDGAAPSDTLVLRDGIYTGSGSDVLRFNKDVTIRAEHPGQALLDGENRRRVIWIDGGTVTLEGLNVTRGSAVSACFGPA